MIALAWRSVLARKLSVLMALASVILGAGLVTATMLIASAQEREGAASVTSWRFSSVDAIVKPTASVTLSSGLALALPAMPRLTGEQLATIASVPGVEGVSAEAPFPAYVVGPDGNLVGDSSVRSWGHPWDTLTADGGQLVEGTEPRTDAEVAIDESLAQASGVDVGDDVRIQLATGTQQFDVTGIVTRAGEQFEHAVFFTPDAAATLGGEPVMALVTTSDVAALEATLSGLTVLSGEGRAGSLQLDLRQAELAGGSSQFLLTIAALALMIAVFVVSSTLTVSVLQRRRELAMLRIVGTRPASIRRMVIWEAALIGAAGGVMGAGIGTGLAGLARNFFVVQGLMAREAEVLVEPTALVVGALAAVAASVFAAIRPARRATRITPLEALREADTPDADGRAMRRAAWGWTALVVGIASLAGVFVLGGPIPTIHGALALLSLVTAFSSLLVGAVLLAPSVLRGMVTMLRPLRARGFSGFFASRSIATDVRRAAGVSVPLTLLVAVSSVLMFQDSANYQARSEVYAHQVTADLVVTGGEQMGVPIGAADAVSHVPGVAAASASVSSRLVIDTPSTARASGTVTGVDPATFSDVLDFRPTEGSWASFDDHSIGISQVVADDKGWRIGDTVEFLMPDGAPGAATVTTIYDDPMGASDMVLPRDTVIPHLLEPFATAIYIAVDPDADIPAVRQAITEALEDTFPGASVVDRGQHLNQVAAQSSGDTWIIVMFVAILGGYAGVSAINVLISSTMARRREFSLLRLAGTRPKALIAAVALESALITLVAVISGTVIAAGTMVGYGYLLADSIWLPFTASTYAVIVGCTFLAAFLGTVVPARAATRADPLESVR